MASIEFEREHWATRIGFILAAVGSAVGLGNIWRFPFQTGQEGGAAFLVVYLFFILLIGLPAMLVEFVIGRRAERNPIDAFSRLGYRKWTVVGAIALLGGFLIMSFYAVVAGWVARYTLASATGGYFDDPEGYFVAVAEGPEAVAFQVLFLAATVGIVALGVQRGIELAVKLLVPSLIAMMVLLIAYGATLDGAMEGYQYYLSPEPGAIAEDWQSILPAAMGQAFFTLSLGMGIMITYASYIDDDRNLIGDGGWIVGIDTAIAIMAGLMIFPVLFTIGVEPGAGGAGELFVGVGGAIAGLPGAELVGILFFGTVLVAALSSAISITEVTVSFLIDHYQLDRPTAAAAVGGALFVIGLPTAMDLAVLELYDELTAEVFLPTTMLLLVLFVGWVYEDAIDEFSKGVDRPWAPDAWLWHVRTVILVVIAITLTVSLYGVVTEPPEIVTGLFTTLVGQAVPA